MSRARHVQLSKRMSFLLRHRPQSAGLELDGAGWIGVDDFLRGVNSGGSDFTLADVEEVVATSDKRRFELADGRIRAAQGHSVDVDLGHEPSTPPAILFHGTVERFLPSIFETGLDKRSRTHVHLSPDRGTAQVVGDRRGDAVTLTVDAAAMHADGHEFIVATNGVWLTDHVPPEYLSR